VPDYLSVSDAFNDSLIETVATKLRSFSVILSVTAYGYEYTLSSLFVIFEKSIDIFSSPNVNLKSYFIFDKSNLFFCSLSSAFVK